MEEVMGGDASKPFAERLRDVLGDDGRFWKPAAILLGVVSFLRGIRKPNIWSATQALVNYDHGLVKRGLFGATLGRWFHLEHYARFSVVSYLLIFALAGLLIALTVRSGAPRRLGRGEPVAVFFASFAITYLAHLVGYFDVPLCILAVLLLLIRNPLLRCAAALPVCVAGLLIHEMFLIVFLPVILLSFAADAARASAQERRRLVAMTVALAAICVGTTVRLAIERPMESAQVVALQQEMTRRADFPLRADFLEVMGRSTVDNLKVMRRMVLHEPGWDADFISCVLIFLPTVLLLLVVLRQLLREAPMWRSNRLLRGGAYVAALSPCAMHALGWDCGRFDALTCLSSFLVVLVLCERTAVTEVEIGAWYRNAAVLAIALSMATGERLMDYVFPHAYPFVQSTTKTIESLRDEGFVPAKVAPKI